MAAKATETCCWLIIYIKAYFMSVYLLVLEAEGVWEYGAEENIWT